jgi:hypothetical protein
LPENAWCPERKKKNNSSLMKCAHFKFYEGKLMMCGTSGSAIISRDRILKM